MELKKLASGFDIQELVGTDSLSKGVFTFKGRKRKLSSKKSQTKRPREEDEDEETRRQIYKEMWEEVERVVGSMQSENFGHVVDQILTFVQEQGHHGWISRKTEIPTACLLTGVNLPDHGDLYGQLRRKLEAEVNCHVASVNSKDVASTVKALFKSVATQLTGVVENEGDGKPMKFRSIRSLNVWYENQYVSMEAGRPPLVVILEDFEMFNPRTIQDFIMTMTMSDLPLVLVFGVATTVESVHRSLPHSVTSHLSIKKFSSEPSIQLLSKLLEQLVLCNQKVPFKLGPRTLKTLLETFMFHDFSVKHFFMAYKFCIMEHFFNSETSILCCGSVFELKTQVKSLDKRQLEKFKSLPSYVAHLKSGGKIIHGESEFKRFLVEKLTQLCFAIKKFAIFVKCLWSSTSHIPKHPLGKFYHSVYSLAIMEPIISTQEYREVLCYLNLAGRTTLEQVLESFIDSLTSLGHQEVISCRSEAKKLLEELQNPIQLEQATPKDSPKSCTESPKTGKLDRFKLQEALLEQAKEKKRQKMSGFEVTRAKIIDFLNSVFKANLVSPMEMVFREVYFFEDPAKVKLRLQGNPRVALQTALQAPHFYLDNENLKVSTLEEIPPGLPDLSIAFKLHLECGRYINLVDWFMCWLSIRGYNVDEGKVVDPELHARFSRCVSEMQVLGFIRPSKRKTDHVERLTWNS